MSYTITNSNVSLSGACLLTQPAPAAPAKNDQPLFYCETGLLKAGDLSKVKALYPEVFLLRQQTAYWFHFAVWAHIFGEEHPDYGFLPVTYESEEDYMVHRNLLVFGSKATRHHFRQWWRKYQKYFDAERIDVDCLPQANTSKRVTGAVIRFPFSNEKLSPTGFIACAEVRDVWAWIVSNCRARVWRLQGAFIFANDVDAVAFKLKWG